MVLREKQSQAQDNKAAKLIERLSNSQNAALEQVARELAKQPTEETPTNYSRMHHRHNRS